MEDCYGKSGDEEDLCKNGTKVAEMKDKRSGMCKCVETFWSNSKLNPTC